MQWISISEYSIIYGFCETNSNDDTISRIYKKNLVNTGDSVFFEKEVKRLLKQIVNSFNKESLVDKRVTVSIPVSRARLFLNKLDSGLCEEEVGSALDWKINQVLPGNETLFTQHYPLHNDDSVGDGQFLSLIISHSLRKTLVNTLAQAGYEPIMMDISLFSAYEVLRKSFPINAYNRWGVWEMAKENDSQNLLIIDNGAVSFISFSFLDNNEVVIHQNTNPEKLNADFVENLIFKNYKNANFDKMFVYSNAPNNVFVQNQIKSENQIIINPIPVLSNQKVQLEKKYLSDKYIVSQFAAIAGLIARYR